MAITGGLWKKFLALLPSEPEYVGTIASVLSYDQYDVTMLSGDVLRATSPDSFTVGTKVFLRGRRITGPAPTLDDLGTVEL